jgi:hypothetical protein
LNNAPGFSPTYTVNYYKLRNNPAWSAWQQAPLAEGVLVPHDELVARLEGLLGHMAKLGGAEMEGEGLDGPAVEIEQIDSETLAVDFDLTKARNNADDAEIDIDFQVRFSCEESEPPIELQNLHVDISAFGDFLSGDDEFEEDKLRRQITENFEKSVNRLFDGNAEGSCTCVNHVDEDGGLVLFGVRPCPIIEDPGEVDGLPPVLDNLQIHGELTVRGGDSPPSPPRVVIAPVTTTTVIRR